MFRKTVQFHEDAPKEELEDAMLQGKALEREALGQLAPCLQNNPELQKLRAKTFLFGGGKGGVGKSLAAVNQGLVLANAGQNALILDFDPAPKVLEALNGRRATTQNVEEFQIGRGRLAIFSVFQTFGAKEFLRKDLELVNNTNNRLYKLLNNLFGAGQNSLRYFNSFDTVLIDIGAGNALLQTSPNFIFNKTIVVTTLEPPARLDAYMYMRTIAAQNTRQPQNFYLTFNCILPEAREKDVLQITNNIAVLWKTKINPFRPGTAVYYSGYIPYSRELAAMPYLSKPRPILPWFAGMSRRMQEIIAAGP
ncbi:MAG: hypothetical protein LBD99_03710 [Candidatus Margulisbacteria bacterium]|jgi:MinD-like ATPase involved in chromosome partitioning or flagellar assembly|nr:hypothetical protein [Candidatus Margulisiibacteriota bacterium]